MDWILYWHGFTLWLIADRIRSAPPFSSDDIFTKSDDLWRSATETLPHDPKLLGYADGLKHLGLEHLDIEVLPTPACSPYYADLI